MTNATKSLALIFAGTLALAVASSWSWSGSSGASFRTKLLTVDTSAVKAVRIARNDGSTIRLQKTESGWTVGSDEAKTAYPAQSSAVTRLLNTLPSISVKAVAARQSDKHPRYGVDSTGTTVTLLDSGDETLGSLLVGRTEFQSRNKENSGKTSPMQRMRRQGTSVTYVRRPNQPDVYSVEASLESMLSKNVEDWRNKTIWSAAQSNVQRIYLTTAGDSAAADTTFSLQRAVASDTASTGPPTWLSNGDTLSTDAVTSVLTTLASPRASGFAEHTSPNQLKNPRHKVRLRLSDGSEHTLKLYPDPSSNDTYLGTASDYPSVARLQKRRWDGVFKPRSTFLK
ncbi:MAG: hypothetical protein BRD55_12280 [Bacteroidetes bacterium SW_9_63_38]|nr:MAG: hypothetical protein BRD55_12280 [Bacteroidetes bacterium SW_9_63_38]